jgi:hypothetical protein
MLSKVVPPVKQLGPLLRSASAPLFVRHIVPRTFSSSAFGHSPTSSSSSSTVPAPTSSSSSSSSVFGPTLRPYTPEELARIQQLPIGLARILINPTAIGRPIIPTGIKTKIDFVKFAKDYSRRHAEAVEQINTEIANTLSEKTVKSVYAILGRLNDNQNLFIYAENVALAIKPVMKDLVTDGIVKEGEDLNIFTMVNKVTKLKPQKGTPEHTNKTEFNKKIDILFDKICSVTGNALKIHANTLVNAIGHMNIELIMEQIEHIEGLGLLRAQLGVYLRNFKSSAKSIKDLIKEHGVGVKIFIYAIVATAVKSLNDDTYNPVIWSTIKTLSGLIMSNDAALTSQRPKENTLLDQILSHTVKNKQGISQACKDVIGKEIKKNPTYINDEHYLLKKRKLNGSPNATKSGSPEQLINDYTNYLTIPFNMAIASLEDPSTVMTTYPQQFLHYNDYTEANKTAFTNTTKQMATLLKNIVNGSAGSTSGGARGISDQNIENNVYKIISASLNKEDPLLEESSFNDEDESSFDENLFNDVFRSVSSLVILQKLKEGSTSASSSSSSTAVSAAASTAPSIFLGATGHVPPSKLAGGTRKHHKQHNKTHKHHKHSNKTKKHRKIRKYTLKRK